MLFDTSAQASMVAVLYAELHYGTLMQPDGKQLLKAVVIHLVQYSCWFCCSITAGVLACCELLLFTGGVTHLESDTCHQWSRQETFKAKLQRTRETKKKMHVKCYNKPVLVPYPIRGFFPTSCRHKVAQACAVLYCLTVRRFGLLLLLLLQGVIDRRPLKTLY